MFLRLAIPVTLFLLWKANRGTDQRTGTDPYGVSAYYRESSDKPSPNYSSGVYSGQKYECVEYARRWLINTFRTTFPSVNDATDLLQLSEATDLDTKRKLRIVSVESPIVGDLIIFRPTPQNNHYGHVAVVVRVTDQEVFLAEQNHSDQKWKGDYSRSIPIVNGKPFHPELAGIRRVQR